MTYFNPNSSSSIPLPDPDSLKREPFIRNTQIPSKKPVERFGQESLENLNPKNVQEANERIKLAAELFKKPTMDSGNIIAALNNLRSAALLNSEKGLEEYEKELTKLIEKSILGDETSSYILHSLYPDHPSVGSIEENKENADKCYEEAMKMMTRPQPAGESEKTVIVKLINLFRKAANYGNTGALKTFNQMLSNLIKKDEFGVLKELYPLPRPLEPLPPSSTPAASVAKTVFAPNPQAEQARPSPVKSPVAAKAEEKGKHEPVAEKGEVENVKPKRGVRFNEEVEVLTDDGKKVPFPTSKSDKAETHREYVRIVNGKEKPVARTFYKSTNEAGNYRKAGVEPGQSNVESEAFVSASLAKQFSGATNYLHNHPSFNRGYDRLGEIVHEILNKEDVDDEDLGILLKSVVYAGVYKDAKDRLKYEEPILKYFVYKVVNDISYAIVAAREEISNVNDIQRRLSGFIFSRENMQDDTITIKDFKKNEDQFYNSPEYEQFSKDIKEGTWIDGKRDIRVVLYTQEEFAVLVNAVNSLLSNSSIDKVIASLKK